MQVYKSLSTLAVVVCCVFFCYFFQAMLLVFFGQDGGLASVVVVNNTGSLVKLECATGKLTVRDKEFGVLQFNNEFPFAIDAEIGNGKGRYRYSVIPIQIDNWRDYGTSSIHIQFHVDQRAYLLLRGTCDPVDEFPLQPPGYPLLGAQK